MCAPSGHRFGLRARRVQSHELAPDVITYSAAISACEKGQQPQTAMSSLALMQPHAWDSMGLQGYNGYEKS